MLAAVRAGRYTDRVLTVLSMIGVSMPVFFLGAMLSYYLGYKAGIFPQRRLRATSPPTRCSGSTHMILPWFTLSVLFVGFYSRVLRSTILDTVNEDFVRTARAKGLSERQVLIRHVLRNSLIPIVSLWGLDFASGDRRRRDPDRDRSSTFTASASTPRQSIQLLDVRHDPGDHDVRRASSSCCSARSSTSSTRCSTRRVRLSA